MANKIPPLNSLKAFESVSRHLNIGEAANELNVTSGAVSQQISKLENLLQIPLLKRTTRHIQLTSAGKQYSKTLQQAFTDIGFATEQLINKHSNKLHLTVEPAFAMYWLLPRIVKFQQLVPHLELQIDTSTNLSQLDDHDIAIRWGQGKYKGLCSELLLRNKLYPVCGPNYLKENKIQTPQDIVNCVLLEDKFESSINPVLNWDLWLETAAVDPSSCKKRTQFDPGFVLIQAAIDNVGITLEREILLQRFINEKTLIKLFDINYTEKNSGYYIVCQESRENEETISIFKQWLREEITKK